MSRARIRRLHFRDVCSCLTYLAHGCAAMGMEITAWTTIRGTHLAALDIVSGSRKRRGRNFRMKASARNGSSPARRAVVTGGAGFLGSHLCIRLLDEGFHVTAIDNLSSGSLRKDRKSVGEVKGVVQAGLGANAQEYSLS